MCSVQMRGLSPTREAFISWAQAGDGGTHGKAGKQWNPPTTRRVCHLHEAARREEGPAPLLQRIRSFRRPFHRGRQSSGLRHSHSMSHTVTSSQRLIPAMLSGERKCDTDKDSAHTSPCARILISGDTEVQNGGCAGASQPADAVWGPRCLAANPVWKAGERCVASTWTCSPGRPLSAPN